MTKRAFVSVLISVLIHSLVLVSIFLFKREINTDLIKIRERERVEILTVNLKVPLMALDSSVRDKFNGNIEYDTSSNTLIDKKNDIPVPQKIGELPKINSDTLYSVKEKDIVDRVSDSMERLVHRAEIPVKNSLRQDDVELPDLPFDRITYGKGDVDNGEKTNKGKKAAEETSLQMQYPIKRFSNIVWNGNKRKLKSQYPIKFPEVIKRVGRDVVVEAEIVVSSAGYVNDVIIKKSSGYGEVDRVVEYALRRYRFNKDPTGNQSIGYIRINFVLKPEE